MGLYASNGMLCTQCEAEGFRRITFFPDRPDVLSVYRCGWKGDKAAVPGAALQRQLRGAGRGRWQRTGPNGTIPGPSRATCSRWWRASWSPTTTFTTMSGRKVDLNIWVRPGDEDRTQHAMDSLKASMKWDEEAFGREYDLDLFNIVAVSDFNMGAMENKGLNVFNTRYVLADPETATDAITTRSRA
jgi:aminopeptidase N